MDREEDPSRRIEATLGEIAAETGGTVHRYPRKGQAVRTVVLRDYEDEGGSRYLEASLETDGVLRVSGRDTGPGVSRFWGPAITTYEWVYVVPADRVENLVRALGGRSGDDALALLAARGQGGETIDDVLRHPTVGASFDNWHS